MHIDTVFHPDVFRIGFQIDMGCEEHILHISFSLTIFSIDFIFGNRELDGH